jgi:two-component system KDP operon response regulator KdpE
MKVLVIDDEPQIRRALRSGLEHSDYEVIVAESGEEGLKTVSEQAPDFVILDLVMPGLDGFHVLQELRSRTKTPVIVLAAHDHADDKVKALELGADDFLTKPFGVHDLLSRMKAVLRRQAHEDEGIVEAVFEHGDLRVDYVHREVVFAGTKIHLTPKEYDLLAYLIHFRNRVLTHRQLLTRVWGEDFANDTHTLRVQIANLRNKVEKDPAHPLHIQTETGIGYRFKADDK